MSQRLEDFSLELPKRIAHTLVYSKFRIYATSCHGKMQHRGTHRSPNQRLIPEHSLGDSRSTMKKRPSSAIAKTPFCNIDLALLLIGLLAYGGCRRSADVVIQPSRTF